MMKKLFAATVATACAIGLAVTAYANRGNGQLGTVYVESQGLYYDTFVPVETLPDEGPFQQLVPMEDGPSVTEFGPGDPGYLGGRWWVDVNGNGEQDEEDSYLLCPLLPQGRPMP